MTTETRGEHPFFMHDHILAQPNAFVSAARRNAEAVDRFGAEIAGSKRLVLVGTGTSNHAAQVGGHVMRGFSRLPTQAWTAFDFCLYGPRLTPEDCVVGISHRGGKRYTVDAMRLARQAGCRTALIAGEGEPVAGEYAEVVFPTVAQERSSAHTVSHTASVAVVTTLAQRLGGQDGGLSDELLREQIPEALRAGIECEAEAKRWADAFFACRRIWLVGGGPSAVVAQEIALKIKETSYLQAEGLAIETMLHGPFTCVEAEDLFVLLAPAGAARERVVELAAMVREIGARYVVVGDRSSSALADGADGSCLVPEVPEPFSALTCLVPLQLFTYHLALQCGTNPDGFRLDDPRFARAHGLIRM